MLDEPAVDVAFALEGRSLPRDHAQALADALAARLPWLAGAPDGGRPPGQGRARRRAAGLVVAACAAAAARAAVARGRRWRCWTVARSAWRGSTLRLGAPTPHRLLPHGTLYAYFVAAASDDEAAFMRDVQAELDALRIDAHTVCGKRQERHSDAGVVVGFSLMLHGLGAADSLTVQRVGIGPHRALGCGLFVPHKSAAAVGA